MISQIEAANPNTVVYLQTVGNVNLAPFRSTTPALLWSSYNGQRQGEALADVVLGRVNPSGHLPFTWYHDESQLAPITDYTIRPTATNPGRTYQYFTGTPDYPFGYGLSYTTFRYSNITVNQSRLTANQTLQVRARVTNKSRVVGSAVPQFYVTTPFEPASAQRPIKRLEGFSKITLNPGESRTVTFTVPVKNLAFFDQTANKYVVDPGRYGLQVGSSSADKDVKLRASVRIHGTIRQRPTVVNAKPIRTGDQERQIQQRVFFDINTTIDPQLTVSMTDESLYGYITKGQSRPLPTGLTVEYTSNRPNAVRVTRNGRLRTVHSGIATIRATVKYHGGTASTKFTVDVAPLAITSNPSAVFQPGQAGTFTVTTSGSPQATLRKSGALPPGITFTDNGDGTATIAGTAPTTTGVYPITITARNGVSRTVRQAFLLYVGTPPTITSGG